jgi:hypothetical protein
LVIVCFVVAKSTQRVVAPGELFLRVPNVEMVESTSCRKLCSVVGIAPARCGARTTYGAIAVAPSALRR